VVQHTALEVHVPGREQPPGVPIRVAPVDAHQAAVLEDHVLEACAREPGQAEVAAGEGAGLKDAGLEGAFRQGTMGEGAVLKGEGLKRLPLGGEVVESGFCIVGSVKKGHAASPLCGCRGCWLRRPGVTASKRWSDRRNPGW